MAEPYLEKLSQQIADLELATSDVLLLEYRHFFNGSALYANGKICATLTPAGFGLKAPANVRDRLITEGAATELRYFEKAPVKKEYVALSRSIVNDAEQMRTLVNLSIGYVTEGE